MPRRSSGNVYIFLSSGTWPEPVCLDLTILYSLDNPQEKMLSVPETEGLFRPPCSITLVLSLMSEEMWFSSVPLTFPWSLGHSSVLITLFDQG